MTLDKEWGGAKWVGFVEASPGCFFIVFFFSPELGLSVCVFSYVCGYTCSGGQRVATMSFSAAFPPCFADGSSH